MTQFGESIAIGIGIGIGIIGPVDDPEHPKPPELDEAFQFVDWAGVPIPKVGNEIPRSDGTREQGVTDIQGKVPRTKSDKPLVDRGQRRRCGKPGRPRLLHRAAALRHPP
jgi:hypothetical protein